jgi:hypothetical protein
MYGEAMIKLYNCVLIFNDHEKLNKWLQDKTKYALRSKYSNKSGKLLVEYDYYEGGKFLQEYYIHKYENTSDFAWTRFGGLEIAQVEFLDGMFEADHINFLLSRIRMGVYEVQDDYFNHEDYVYD